MITWTKDQLRYFAETDDRHITDVTHTPTRIVR